MSNDWDSGWGEEGSWAGFQEPEEDTVDVDYTVDDSYVNKDYKVAKKIGVFGLGVFLLGAAKKLIDSSLD